ncbi:unnamed protein product [Nippostrongylus brasiliensis]|uniref:Neurogenic locus notch homolog protein 1 (inferred by orthology to a zebrafish protein) n=1 Tax=Nippostrongylus brasiliensis TaxID=27835 RepID=A0A0N4Y0E1_NIPBR|nr:unnamed protein product [Nippostrongylus brasiliensis]
MRSNDKEDDQSFCVILVDDNVLKGHSDLFCKGVSEVHGSGVFTMTFSSADVAYLSLCYMEWPSFTACLFHPYPYNFTIRPGTPTKIGRPLRNLQSDHITVSINVTDNSGDRLDESETASGVISRLVSRKRAYHDAVLLMEQRSGKYSFVISGSWCRVLACGAILKHVALCGLESHLPNAVPTPVSDSVIIIMSSLLHILLLFSLSVAVKCSKNPCDSDPCALGECVAEGSSYRCVCYEGYVGRICDTNRLPSENCDVDGPYKCRNGGTCNTTDNEFMCVCPANYKGFFCEEDVDECLSSPCQNGATCVNRDGDFYCMCPRGFKGKTCEERAETCSQSVDICGNCSSKIGNGKCDRECDREECGYDGGECAAHQPTPFHECGSSLYCSRVFRDGVCDEICNNEACLFDGFDCTPKTSVCPERCRIRKNNGICDPECNVERCDFDGDDCGGDHTNLLHGELSIILTTTSEHFVRNIPSFQQALTKLLRANVRIKKDRSGLLIFFWKDGEVGERITIGKQVCYLSLALAF